MLLNRILINLSLLRQGKIRPCEIPPKIINRLFNYSRLARGAKRKGFPINEVVFRPIAAGDKLRYLKFINSYFERDTTCAEKEITMPECSEEHFCYVALYYDKIVGRVEFIRSLSQAGNIWQVGGLAILPDFRGLGIGEKIMKKSISAFCEKEAIIFLSVDKENLRAIKLYKKLGFKIATQAEKTMINPIESPLHKKIMILVRTSTVEFK